MDRIDVIKQKIHELEDEVNLLEQGTDSHAFWETLLNDIGSDHLDVLDMIHCATVDDAFIIDTTRIDEFGRLEKLHNAGYYVDAFRQESGIGSRFWINKL